MVCYPDAPDYGYGNTEVGICLECGKTAEEAKANTGWDLKVAKELKNTAPVTEEELRILREELDPTGIYLKGGG